MAGIDGYDWSIFGANPAPGDPDATRMLAVALGDLADGVRTQNRLLQSVGSDSESIWTGPAADAFKPLIGKLPGQLDKLITSYGAAADALNAYWPRLRSAQETAVQAWYKGTAAKAQLAQAQQAASAAAASASSAANAYNQAATTAASAPPDPSGATTAHVATLQSAYQSASAAATTANANVAAAQAAWKAAQDLYNSAHTQARSAASTVAGGLRSASHAGIQNPHHSWFSSVVDDIGGALSGAVHWAEHHWEYLVPGGIEVMAMIKAGQWLSKNWVEVLKVGSAVLGGIATVAGVLSFIPVVGEFALPVALVAAGLGTLDDTVLAATGHGSWSTVGLDAVGDLGFGGGEALSFAAKGLVEADKTAEAVSEAEKLASSTRDVISPLRSAADDYSAMGDGRVFVAGKDGIESTKASEMVSDLESRIAPHQEVLDSAETRIEEGNSKLEDLPGQQNTFKYSIKTFNPSEEQSTLSRVGQYFSHPGQYAQSVLRPGDLNDAPSSLRSLMSSEGKEMWTGAGRVPYRISVGVGAGGTALGTYVDKGSWQDALSGK